MDRKGTFGVLIPYAKSWSGGFRVIPCRFQMLRGDILADPQQRSFSSWKVSISRRLGLDPFLSTDERLVPLYFSPLLTISNCQLFIGHRIRAYVNHSSLNENNNYGKIKSFKKVEFSFFFFSFCESFYFCYNFYLFIF